jgi:hypothetical protein
MNGACALCHGPARTPRKNAYRGERFGVDGMVCNHCYQRLLARQGVRPCDLCGDPGGPPKRPGDRPCRVSGRRFALVGLICLGCYRELVAERRAAGEVVPERRRECRPRPRALPVLGDGFTLDDLTPRAACAVILARTRPVFGRRRTG